MNFFPLSSSSSTTPYMPSVIVDDAQLRGLGNCSFDTSSANSYRGTISFCRPGNTTSPFIYVNFVGDEISLVGRPTTGLKFNYTIDGSSMQPVVLSSDETDAGKDGVLLWKLQGLDENVGAHSLQIYPIVGSLNLDYITYKTSADLSISQNVVVIDDQDPLEAVTYTGLWRDESLVSLSSGYPFNGTYSQARNSGASFTLDFTGSSIAIHGLLNSVAGRLVASYAIDNRRPVNVTHFDGLQPADASHWALSQTLYMERLLPGKHQLTVTLLEATGSQAFYFDYATYKASTSPTFTTSALIIPTDNNTGFRIINIGAIIGGAVAFLIFVYCIRFFMRRRNYPQPLVPLIPPGRAWQAPPPPWSPPPPNPWGPGGPPIPRPMPMPMPMPMPIPRPPSMPQPPPAWQPPRRNSDTSRTRPRQSRSPQPQPPRDVELQPEVGFQPHTPRPFSPPSFPPPGRLDEARFSVESLEPAAPELQPHVGVGPSPGPPEPGVGINLHSPGQPSVGSAPPLPAGAPPAYVV